MSNSEIMESQDLSQYFDGINFYCTYNALVSLVGAPKEVGSHFICGSPEYTIDLLGITTKQINGEFQILGQAINLLSLFDIRDIKNVKLPGMDKQIAQIINQYIHLGIRGKLQCQAALYAAGLDKYV